MINSCLFLIIPVASQTFFAYGITRMSVRSALPLATNGTQELHINYSWNIIIWNITWVITCVLHVASQTRIPFRGTEKN